MRWGLIGTGAHAAQKIAPALAIVPGQHLHGVVGSAADKSEGFATAHGGHPYPTLAAMLADPAIDAVFVTTPNDRHCGEVLQAAVAGKHVLVEKPMALTSADCEAMIAACARAGVALGVGFQQRHAPAHQQLRRMITDGTLGEIVLVRGEWHTAYPAWRNWRADRERAGSDILAAVGVHVFDLLGFLAGSAVRDVACLVDIGPDTGLDQTLAASLRYENGVMGTVTITRHARAAMNSVFVLGTKGQATGVGTLGMAPTGLLETVIEGKAEAHRLPVRDLYAAQFEAFAAAVARGEPPSADGRDGLASVWLAGQLLAGH